MSTRPGQRLWQALPPLGFDASCHGVSGRDIVSSSGHRPYVSTSTSYPEGRTATISGSTTLPRRQIAFAWALPWVCGWYMRRALTFTGAFLAMWGNAPAYGIEILPPNPVPAYSLIVVQYAEGDSVDVVRIVDGLPQEVTVLDCANGRMAFTGPPGGYLVGAFESGRLRFYAVRIVGNGPIPPEPPDPPNPPNPPTPPDGEFGLSKFIYDLAVKLPAQERRHAAAVAANFQWGAEELGRRMLAVPAEQKQCVGGVCYVPGRIADQIYEIVASEVRGRNAATHGNTAPWLQIGKEINAKLNEVRRTNSKLRLVAGFKAALLELAAGLKAID